MERLEVSGAVRPLYGSLGVKGLVVCTGVRLWSVSCVHIYTVVQAVLWIGESEIRRSAAAAAYPLRIDDNT